MRTHYLKTLPVYFDRVEDGTKTFEVRKNDRDFQTGDILCLVRFDPERDVWNGPETARNSPSVLRRVSYALHGGQFGIEEGYVVMGLSTETDR